MSAALSRTRLIIGAVLVGVVVLVVWQTAQLQSSSNTASTTPATHPTAPAAPPQEPPKPIQLPAHIAEDDLAALQQLKEALLETTTRLRLLEEQATAQTAAYDARVKELNDALQASQQLAAGLSDFRAQLQRETDDARAACRVTEQELEAQKIGQATLMQRAERVLDRPDIASLLVTSWDTLEVAADVPAQYQQVAEELRRCIAQLDYRSLPDIDEIMNHTACSPTYVPWRRGSSYARLAYCVGKLEGVNTFMEAFLSHGGSAIMPAQAMLDSNKTETLVTGWEIEPDVIAKVRQHVETRLPNLKIREGSTLVAGSVVFNSTSMRLISARGDMVDWCRSHKVDAILVDAGWGTFFYINGERTENAEAFVGYEICKPKYMLQVSANLHHATDLVRRLSTGRGEYVSLAVGWARGVACGNSLTGSRMIELLARMEEPVQNI